MSRPEYSKAVGMPGGRRQEQPTALILEKGKSTEDTHQFRTSKVLVREGGNHGIKGRRMRHMSARSQRGSC